MKNIVSDTITAYRGWGICDSDKSPLTSPTSMLGKHRWEIRTAKPSECLFYPMNHSKSPSKDCSCGYFSTKSIVAYEISGTIVGETYIWGKVQEHSLGYRSEFAYPKRFLGFRCIECGNIGNMYGLCPKCVYLHTSSPIRHGRVCVECHVVFAKSSPVCYFMSVFKSEQIFQQVLDRLAGYGVPLDFEPIRWTDEAIEKAEAGSDQWY